MSTDLWTRSEGQKERDDFEGFLAGGHQLFQLSKGKICKSRFHGREHDRVSSLGLTLLQVWIASSGASAFLATAGSRASLDPLGMKKRKEKRSRGLLGEWS